MTNFEILLSLFILNLLVLLFEIKRSDKRLELKYSEEFKLFSLKDNLALFDKDKISNLMSFIEKICVKHNIQVPNIFFSIKEDGASSLILPWSKKNKKSIIINKSLLSKANEDTLKCILAHELYHQIKNHTFKGKTLFVMLSLGITTLFNFLAMSYFKDLNLVLVNLLVLHLSQHLMIPLFSSYSQYIEKQSDLFAAQQTSINTYHEMCILFNSEDESPCFLNQFVSTHPLWSERLSFVKQNLKPTP
jgi:Zn-dependent protease with chaperone function